MSPEMRVASASSGTKRAPLSTVPSQSLSTPSQISIPPGKAAALASSQSSPHASGLARTRRAARAVAVAVDVERRRPVARTPRSRLARVSRAGVAVVAIHRVQRDALPPRRGAAPSGEGAAPPSGCRCLRGSWPAEHRLAEVLDAGAVGVRPRTPARAAPAAGCSARSARRTRRERAAERNRRPSSGPRRASARLPARRRRHRRVTARRIERIRPIPATSIGSHEPRIAVVVARRARRARRTGCRSRSPRRRTRRWQSAAAAATDHPVGLDRPARRRRRRSPARTDRSVRILHVDEAPLSGAPKAARLVVRIAREIGDRRLGVRTAGVLVLFERIPPCVGCRPPAGRDGRERRPRRLPPADGSSTMTVWPQPTARPSPGAVRRGVSGGARSAVACRHAIDSSRARHAFDSDGSVLDATTSGGSLPPGCNPTCLLAGALMYLSTMHTRNLLTIALLAAPLWRSPPHGVRR